jgi:hypothetical protein
VFCQKNNFFIFFLFFSPIFVPKATRALFKRSARSGNRLGVHSHVIGLSRRHRCAPRGFFEKIFLNIHCLREERIAKASELKNLRAKASELSNSKDG